jgi:putative hydrolase of the HAD superfamily
MPSAIRVVLSDLDDTLFDHAHATRQALARLRDVTPDLARWSLDQLDARHGELLEELHAEVVAGRVPIEAARAERFRRLLSSASGGRRTTAAADAAQLYRREYEAAWQPIAGAIALVAAIKAAGVHLVVVTNNVVHEQRIKLDRCGLALYVDAMVTSEEAGLSKPDPRIFHEALARVGAEPAEAVMLGDAWATDIAGAQAAGVRAVWFNRPGAPSPDLSVPELRALDPTADALRVLLGSDESL